MKSASKIIAYVLIVLSLVGVLGTIAKFTSGFTSDFKTFYVTVDGKDIMTTANNYTLTHRDTMKVDVKYTFSSNEVNVSGYSVKVIPNVIEGKDFDFEADGLIHSYHNVENLTKGFIIEESKSTFTITPKGDLTEILKAVYPDSEIADCTDKMYNNMFSLVITSYNGESSVIINFTVIEEAEKIVLDKENCIL